MNFPQLLSIIGTIPLFSMRTFFPAFLTALFFAHPEWFPGVENIEGVAEQGTFLAQNWLVILLGVLSILEFVADKNTDVRQFLREAEPYMKPISYLLIQFFIMSENSEEVLEQVNWAGFNPLIIIAVIGSGAVYFLSMLRKRFLNFLSDIDEDDNLYIGKIISWIEDSLVLFGFLLLIWTGVFMIILYAIIIGIFLLLRKLNEKRIENEKNICPNCGAKVYPFAIRCQQCGHEQPAIFDIGIFGNRKANLISDFRKHEFKLLAQRRCPSCATKSKIRSPFQKCSTCNTEFFKNPTINEFIKHQDRKFQLVFVLSFVIGLLPIIGFVITAGITGISLLSPYRLYISESGNFISKILIRFVTILLFILGIGAGFIASPLYCLIRYTIIKNQFKIITKTFESPVKVISSKINKLKAKSS
ncbi:MAG TPA: zinc ribbon domain-containing protein [Bacteroidales bacterium]|nr:zinc ribbon domain-containing protein [Bacteroidales bacterium]